jgi:hypothetical protein
MNWKDVEEKKLEPIPYKPNPMKYRYLLQNKYEPVTFSKGSSPQADSPKKNNVLGGLTLYKINKELEDF